MKTLVAKTAQFLTDANGKRTGVLLDLETYQQLRDAEEELADIQTYDALRDKAHAEIAAGQAVTLTSYRAARRRKGK